MSAGCTASAVRAPSFWRRRSSSGPVGSVSSAASRLTQPPTVTAEAGKTYAFSSTRQGTAHGGTWKDDKNSILQADPSGKVAFPLFIFNSPRFGDMDYTGQFLIESGDEDRYAGFVFRLRSAGDYYAVRFSASENNVFFARFDAGVRTILQRFDAKISSKQWHTVRLVARKDAVTIFLDGRKIGTARDAKWRIGKVGLGTKADSVTRFRKLSIKTTGSGPTPTVPPAATVAPPTKPGPWKQLGAAVGSSAGKQLHFYRQADNPHALGLVVTSSSPLPIHVYWVSYCEFDSDDGETLSDEGTLTGVHSVEAYPPTFPAATLCYVWVNAGASGTATVSAAVFSY
jgi:hypothetical protein